MADAYKIDAEIYENRDSIIVHRQWTDPNGVATDLTGATIAGSIKTNHADAAALASITFDNTLASGIIKGYLASADYAAVMAGEESGVVYYDIYVTQSGGLKLQSYEGKLTLNDTVTV